MASRIFQEGDFSDLFPDNAQATTATSVVNERESATSYAEALSISTKHGPEASLQSGSDSDSDIELRRPIGRAARRMLRGQQSPQARQAHQSASDSEDELYYATPLRTRRKGDTTHETLAASAMSSTLFVSPAKSEQDESKHELQPAPFERQSRLAALVAEKHAERLAREAEERQRNDHISSDLPEELLETSQAPVNEAIERIMSDAVKPTRKASKKAMREMEAETQRLARQQALAHQMKVRKKFTTSDLFARFNFRAFGESSDGALVEGDSASSALNSDSAEGASREPVSTPPSSPPTPLDRQRALVERGALSKFLTVREDSLASLAAPLMDDGDHDEELPDMTEILSSSRLNKQDAERRIEERLPPQRGLKLTGLGEISKAAPNTDASDDDLEIISNPPSRVTIFEKAKGIMKRENTDSKAVHTLKHLAHLGADIAQVNRSKLGSHRPSVNPQVLEARLRLRAKAQAHTQQMERIAELKAKGVEVQTVEEREREQEAFENLLDKARQEAVELRKAEKATAKGDAVTADGDAATGHDESEDDEYVDESESEDEVDVAADGSNDILDDDADESHDEEESEEGEEAGEEEEEEEEGNDENGERVFGHADNQLDTDPHDVEKQEVDVLATPRKSPAQLYGRKPRNSRVVADDDDDDDDDTDADRPLQHPHNIAEVEEDGEDDDPFAAFNIGGAKPGSSLMSPTQVFNATMQTPTQLTQQESLDTLRYLVPPSSSSLPPLSPLLPMHTQSESQEEIIPGSQVPPSQQLNLLWEIQAPKTPIPSVNRGNSDLTLETPMWQPTQDDGLSATVHNTPLLGRVNTMESAGDEHTQSTVRLRISESPAPPPSAVQERKRLVRGPRARRGSSDNEVALEASASHQQKDAFREMARKRREALSAAELAEAEREAKGMMDEQAEESEDEYAGLGGDDFVAPESEQDREMIDSSHIDVNEQELAALYAERQRAADEAAANQLYKDLTTGALRRKQANAFDLDEDEDDLAVRRRQMRQREEARKRKLLLQDDNIAGLAEGKRSMGKDAFLKAIADDDARDDDTLELSDVDEGESVNTASGSQASQPTESQTDPLREVSGNKRRLQELTGDRPPAKMRRTKTSAFRAPTSFLEVQESVSFLLDEPHAATVGPSVLDLSSDSEKDEGEQHEDDEQSVQAELDRQNDGAAMPTPRLPALERRTAPTKPAIVDRLSLKRGSSASESTAGRTAWAATSSEGFKIPSLLRRATTNTAFAANERGVTTSNGISRENNGVRMGGTKKSSLAYQARAEERKAIVEASTKKRAENTARIAQLRRASCGGFGKGLGGRFE